MDLSVLRKIGLSNGETLVYAALLNVGVTSLNGIQEKVNMDRRNIYDILNKLIERGFVSYIEENGKRTFKATNPEKIINYIEEKKSDLNNIKEEVKTILPDLQSVFNEEKEELFAEIFRGAAGLRSAWDDMLNFDVIRWIGSGNYVPDKFPAFWNDWDNRRIKKNVESIHLFRQEKRKEVNKKRVKQFRFLPKEFSGNATVTAVYGDKVAQMIFGEKILVFVITSKDLAENYKEYHKFLWDNVAEK